MVEKHNFSEERILKVIDKLSQQEKDKKQKGLGEWVK